VSARTPAADPGQIRDYLLRRMPESARARFEEAYFKDDVLLDRIEAEEDLLVSDYVLGKLAETDRRRFEQSLLGTPYYQERVRTTSQLNLQLARVRFKRPAAAARPRDGENLFPGRSGAAVAFAVLAVLLVAAVVTATKLKSELDRAERDAAPAAALAPDTVVLDGAAADARLLSRDARTPLLVVVPRRLVPASAREWRLALLSEDGAVVWESPVARVADLAPGADLATRLPAGVPAAGKVSFVLKTGGGFQAPLVPLGAVDLR